MPRETSIEACTFGRATHDWSFTVGAQRFGLVEQYADCTTIYCGGASSDLPYPAPAVSGIVLFPVLILAFLLIRGMRGRKNSFADTSFQRDVPPTRRNRTRQPSKNVRRFHKKGR
jgi:hypothetical protein